MRFTYWPLLVQQVNHHFFPFFFGTCKDTAGWLWPVGTSPELGSWYGRPYAPTSSIQICTQHTNKCVFRPSFNSLLLRFVFIYPDDSSINKYRSIFFLLPQSKKHICMVHDNDVSVLYACDACSGRSWFALSSTHPAIHHSRLAGTSCMYMMTNVERKSSVSS